MGFTLRQGAVPTGQDVTIGGATARASVLNRWPDGSVRFCVIGGTYSSTGGTPSTITVGAGSVSPGASLTASAVQTAMASNLAEFGCGAFGTVTFSGGDFSSPFHTHFANDLCAEFVYRKQVGSDAHLVAWLHVRYWSTGELEFLPVLENGYLQVAGPTSKSATFTFTLGGSSRFSAAIVLPHHCRTPLVSGSTLSHWLGTAPGVDFKHDSLYMQSTEVVPTYLANVSPSNTLVTNLPSTYTPLQAGSFDYASDAMQSGGASPSIGLLPEHDVLYLTTTAYTAASVQRNGYSAGRYPLHWRDETTNRPPLFASYPTLGIGSSQGVTNTGNGGITTFTPAISGTTPPPWDMAHCPSVGYMAYLITGRFYHMETAQFAAVTNHFHNGTNIRGTGAGIQRSFPGAVDTRGGAWGTRSLWQALAITPDDDAIFRPTLKASLQATIDFHHGRYVAQPNNPLGYTEPGQDFLGSQSGAYGDRNWFQDFSVGVWGFMRCALPLLDSGYSTKVAQFFDWHAVGAVGRLGDPDDANAWPYINAAPYTIAIAASDSPDWAGGTGPWYSSFRAAYNATYQTPPPWLGSTAGTLAAEIMPGAMSYWGNLQPAIAYAVRHGVSGARAAYMRMASADNWVRLATQFNTAPVWSFKPATGLLPSYLETAAVGEVVAIPNSILDASNNTAGRLAFGNIHLFRDEAILAAGGGHNNGGANNVSGFDVVTATGWTTRKASDWNGVEANVAYYDSGSPAARHLYNTAQYSQARSRLMLHGSPVVHGGAAVSFPDSNGFNLATNTWDADGAHPDAPEPVICQDADGNCWASAGSPTNYLHKWTATTDTWTQAGYHGGGTNRPLPPMANHGSDNYLFSLANVAGVIRSFKITSNGTVFTPITFNASSAYSAWLAERPENETMVWDEVNGRFLIFGDKSTALYAITPNATAVWDMTTVTKTGATIPAPAEAFGRMQKHIAGRFLIFAPGVNQSLYAMRYA